MVTILPGIWIVRGEPPQQLSSPTEPVEDRTHEESNHLPHSSHPEDIQAKEGSSISYLETLLLGIVMTVTGLLRVSEGRYHMIALFE